MDKVKLRVLPAEGLRLGSANHGHPRAEWADLTKNEFFGAVTCLKVGLAEFGYPLHQHLQTRRLLWSLSLILDQWQKEVLVRPLGCIGQIKMEPPSRGDFPASPEVGLRVLILMVMVQHQPQAREHLVLITSWRIEIPKKY
jgi:hypothetical protein